MIDTILKYFTLTDKQKQQFEQIGNLYPEWNAKINVISRKDIDNLWVNHILHSLAIAKFINPVTGTTFLDMGTGGGFPGIPLAIMWPECKLHLIDRIGKKIKVAQDIAQQIGLDNVTFQHGDIGECRNTYDFVVSRAVMPLTDLLKIIRKNISQEQHNALPNGLICLKGGELGQETMPVKHKTVIYDLKEEFDEDFFETKKVVYVTING